MAFIRAIPPSNAEGPVREMYEQSLARFGYVPNWAQAFSLRPGEGLRAHGYQDEEIFDLAATAARCFFSKLLGALGVQADSAFNDLDPALRRALTVGRPVADRSE
jgi:hypothetical protein